MLDVLAAVRCVCAESAGNGFGKVGHLQELDAAILKRNVRRQHPLWSMAPQFMDSSVGS